jgi:hypothetical protein
MVADRQMVFMTVAIRRIFAEPPWLEQAPQIMIRAITNVSFRGFRLGCSPVGRFFRECGRID